jgi:Domain of unknown function (DUF3395)
VNTAIECAASKLLLVIVYICTANVLAFSVTLWFILFNCPTYSTCLLLSLHNRTCTLNTTAAAEEEAQAVEVVQQRYANARTAAAQQAKLMVHMASKKRAAEAANADSGLIIIRARYGLDLHIDYGER